MQVLLEPIAAGQTRFRMHGLVPDARGIAIGRELLVVLPSIDWTVAFLGAYSDEASLDDLIPTMTIEHARRDSGGGAIVVRCSSGDGYAVDRVARLAAAARGQLYTGAGSTFVRWRDRDAPFGYDLVAPVGHAPDEVVVVDLEYSARYVAQHRMDPVDLIQRLQLRPVPIPLGGVSRDPDLAGLKEMALVLVAPALAHRALRYLWRLEVAMAGYYVTLQGDRRASLLLRMRQPRARVLDVLFGTPGIELLAPVSPRAAVEVGWRHPIQLASVSASLPGDEMFLFRGGAGRVERLEGPPRFVDGRHLVESNAGFVLRDVAPLREAELDPLRVELRIRPTRSPREPRATLIAWDQIGLLRHLVYLVPPSALAASRLVPLEQGVLVLTGSSVLQRGPASVGTSLVIPLGQRLGELAPGVLVPDGYELWPRIRPQLLRQLLGLTGEDHAIYLSPDGDPVRVRAEQLLPFDAALVGRLALGEASARAPDLPPIVAGSIKNTKLGRFALWGYGGPAVTEPRPAGVEGDGEGPTGE